MNLQRLPGGATAIPCSSRCAQSTLTRRLSLGCCASRPFINSSGTPWQTSMRDHEVLPVHSMSPLSWTTLTKEDRVRLVLLVTHQALVSPWSQPGAPLIVHSGIPLLVTWTGRPILRITYAHRVMKRKIVPYGCHHRFLLLCVQPPPHDMLFSH